ncbi:MAG: hypothetical protein ABMB14_26680 [Myxococcota bacterium]
MRQVHPAWAGLTVAALVGASAASAVVLGWDGSFPDPPGASFDAAQAEARGWSAVTLGLAVPIGGIALRAAIRGSIAGRIGWAGSMAYLVYTFLEFAVSPPFTALYLVYVATYALALAAGIGALTGFDPADLAALPDRFARAPRRGIAAYAVLFSSLLAAAWLRDIAGRTAAGAFGYPQGVDAIGHVVHALDLGLLVPLGLATGILLWIRHPAAWVVAGIQLVIAVDMGLALAAMVGASGIAAGTGPWAAIPFLVAWAVWAGLAGVAIRTPAAD